MRRSIVIRLALFLGLLGYVLFLTFSRGPDVIKFSYASILGAHRGDSVDYLENTIEAFKAAADDDQYKFIEFDVQYTQDRRPVVFHDATLLRMEFKPYVVGFLTYDELQATTDYHVPLYEEVIDAIDGRKKINVEIKSSGDLELDADIVEYIVEHAKYNGYLKDMMISSISKDVIKYVNDTFPDIKTGQVFLTGLSTYLGSEYLTNRFFDVAYESGADYILLYGSNMRNFENLINVKPIGKTIGIWYFNNEVRIILKDEVDELW